MTSNTDTKSKAVSVVSAVGPTTGGALGGAIGAAIGGPFGGALGGAIGGLIPSLTDIPATKRNRERMVEAMKEVDKRLSSETEALRQLNDQQFKIINESIITLSETLEAEKIEYLKEIILTSVRYDDFSSYDSILLSRIIRDISAQEIGFLIANFSYKTINIYSWYNENSDNCQCRRNTAGICRGAQIATF